MTVDGFFGQLSARRRSTYHRVSKEHFGATSLSLTCGTRLARCPMGERTRDRHIGRRQQKAVHLGPAALIDCSGAATRTQNHHELARRCCPHRCVREALSFEGRNSRHSGGHQRAAVEMRVPTS